MSPSRFLPEAFRPALLIRLSLLASILFGFTLSAAAQTAPDLQDNPLNSLGVMDVVVAEVQGTIIKVEGGIQIDISDAITGGFGIPGIPINTIQPGMNLRITIARFDQASSMYVAGFVRPRVANEIILSGSIQDGGFEQGFVTVMNQRLLITSRTAMLDKFKSPKLRIGLQVTVLAQVNGSERVALIVFPHYLMPSIFP